MPNNTDADMLGNLDTAYQKLFDVARTALNVDMAKVTDPQQREGIISKLKTMGYDIGNVGDTVSNGAQKIDDLAKKVQQATGVVAPIDNSIKSHRIVFNLKKAQSMPTDASELPSTNVDMSDETDPLAGVKFNDGADVKNWLTEVGDPTKAIQILGDRYSNENQVVTDPETNYQGETLGVIKDAVNDFYSTSDEQQKLDAASTLFETVMPNGSKSNVPVQDSEIPSIQENVNIADLVSQSNIAIKKIAEKHAQIQNVQVGSFNLTKEAQHKSLENVIMFPPQNHVDQFTGQLINDWHLVERNKGFGLKIDNIFNIDFESIWRNTIMDKYTPTYIEDRFEVDRNIPTFNNLRLEDGHKRRITPPEYGNTEARLEANRDDMNKERGYDPSENTKPFNWKKASYDSKKKVTAAGENTGPGNMSKDGPSLPKIDGLKPLPEIKMPGEKSLNTNTTKYCPICGNATSKNRPDFCTACNVAVKAMDSGKVQTSPNEQGSPGLVARNEYIQKNQQLSNVPVQQRANQYLNRAASIAHEDTGIFFDGGNFICYAKKKKHKFHTYDEAEKFKQMPSSDLTNPSTISGKRQQTQKGIPSDPDSSVQDCHNIVDNLGIDG